MSPTWNQKLRRTELLPPPSWSGTKENWNLVICSRRVGLTCVLQNITEPFAQHGIWHKLNKDFFLNDE